MTDNLEDREVVATDDQNKTSDANIREYGECPNCGEKDLVTNVNNHFTCNACGCSTWDEVED